MGSIGTLFAATLVAVTYGWIPASSDDEGEPTTATNGYEYLVQVGDEDRRALAEGRVTALSSATPEGMKSIDRVRIIFGEGDLPRRWTDVDRTSPKRIAKLSQAAVKHTVAKPVVSDWLPVRSEASSQALGEETGQRHTVFQQPGYQNPGSLGNEVVRRSDAMQRGFADAVRNTPRNLGNYAGQTTRDLAQGTRGVVEGALGGIRDTVRAGANGFGNVANDAVNLGNRQYFEQRRQERSQQEQRQQEQRQANSATPGTQQPGYTPYNYESQTQPAGQNNFLSQGQGANSQANTPNSYAENDYSPGTNLNRQSPDDRTQGPAFPSSTERPANGGGIATTFGSSVNSASPSDGGQSFRGDGTNQDYNDYPRNNPGVYEDRQPFADRRDEGHMTPVARETPRLAPSQGFGSRREEPYRSPQQSQYNDWNKNRPAATSADTADHWNVPPINTRPVTQTADFQTSNSNQGALSDAASWGDSRANSNVPNYNQNGSQNNEFANNAANHGNQQSASLGNPFSNPWLMIFLLGSLAGNVYVATSYLDVRNKYRAALRRGPSGYQHGV